MLKVENYLKRKKPDSYWYDVWEKFKKGDKKAFETIYNEHIDFLYNYGLNVSVNIELVEDSIQDLFLYLLSKKDQIVTPNYVRYYLLKAFKRILMEKIRKNKNTTISIDDNSFDFNFEIETDGVVEKQLEEKKILLVEKLIDGLDARKKEVIFLKFQSGLSYSEIADIVGIEPSSVKKIVYRTVSSFREIVKNKTIELLSIFFNILKR